MKSDPIYTIIYYILGKRGLPETATSAVSHYQTQYFVCVDMSSLIQTDDCSLATMSATPA